MKEKKLNQLTSTQKFGETKPSKKNKKDGDKSSKRKPSQKDAKGESAGQYTKSPKTRSNNFDRFKTNKTKNPRKKIERRKDNSNESRFKKKSFSQKNAKGESAGQYTKSPKTRSNNFDRFKTNKSENPSKKIERRKDKSNESKFKKKSFSQKDAKGESAGQYTKSPKTRSNNFDRFKTNKSENPSKKIERRKDNSDESKFKKKSFSQKNAKGESAGQQRKIVKFKGTNTNKSGENDRDNAHQSNLYKDSVAKKNKTRAQSFRQDKLTKHKARSANKSTAFKPIHSKRKPTYSRHKNSKETPDNFSHQTETGAKRINRFIAQSGVCSRREAEQLILAGDIKVNNKIVKELSFQVQSTDQVKYKDKVLSTAPYQYLLLNKPKGYITTTKDTHDRKTVMDLIDSKVMTNRVYPVGRLDRQTTGVLLLTNDGDLAKTLTHPSSEISKIYQITLDKSLSKNDYIKIMQGVELEDGQVVVDDLAYVDGNDNIIGLEIHSGRNRVIRRVFEKLEYQVEKLDRVLFAGLSKKGLTRGKWRTLNEKEVRTLKHFTPKNIL